MIDDSRFSHLVKFAQHGGLINIRENLKVANALGARFAIVQARPRLVAAIYHIATVFLTVCHKPIALGNGTGAVWFRIRVIQATVIAIHRTHDALTPNRQRKDADTGIYSEQKHGTN